ncbi:hypothetical protein [Rufibacter roseolus]|uniref:hypothetical protein n=1 Tax=Rufibacter roseolus TaxID=2817375 RepID=UPI001B31394C|nr:hypothetical protein [Rufibacter roseolus]
MHFLKINFSILYPLGIFSCLGLFSCGQEKHEDIKAKEAHTLTLIKFGYADSANTQNKGLSIYSYTYINLINDSVSAYFKTYHPNLEAKPEIKQTSGFINGIGQDSTLLKFIKRRKNLPLRKSHSTESNHHGEPFFVLVTQTGSTKKIQQSYNYEYDPATKYSLQYIDRLIHNTGLKNVKVSLNEDSVLVPLLNDPEFSTFPYPPSSPTINN